MTLSEQIIALRNQGKSYRQIEKELGCAKSTVAYHLSERERQNVKKRQIKLRESNQLARKVENFQSDLQKLRKSKKAKLERFASGNNEYVKPRFTYADVEDKYGTHPVCYLTGEPIDLQSPQSFQFDHIVPRSKGGSNEIENLGITTRDANQAKHDMALDDFLDLCEKVLRYHGRIS